MSTAPAIPAYSDMHVGPELTVVALPALKLSVSDSETVRIVIEHLLSFDSGKWKDDVALMSFLRSL
jgi:hypothetical protein